VSRKLERATGNIYRGEPVMSNEVNDAWWERAYEEHYEDLKAEGKTDEEILQILTDLFYNSAP